MPSLIRRIYPSTTPLKCENKGSGSLILSPTSQRKHYNTLNWNDHSKTHQALANFNIATFNLLAPCYKRLPILSTTSSSPSNNSNSKLFTTREAGDSTKWKTRAANTLQFFNSYLFHTTSIIALQEFWLDDDYSQQFNNAFSSNGYDLKTLQRTGYKTDAVALAIKKDTFTIIDSYDISLCSIGDRVALLLWIKHIQTGKDILVANTHLSFPHNSIDRISQMRQMKKLTSIIDSYAMEHSINHATRIILGDFNVQGESPVCDHLRSEGYFSCLEVCPPINSKSYNNDDNFITTSILRPESSNKNLIHKLRDNPLNTLKKPNSLHKIESDAKFLFNQAIHRYSINFVSHRTHRNEDLGVDHIFIKPEYEYEEMKLINDNDQSSMYITEYCTGAVFVDGTEVIPVSIPCDTWNDRFTISDHRPVGACIVFGSSKYNQISRNINNKKNQNDSVKL